MSLRSLPKTDTDIDDQISPRGGNLEDDKNMQRPGFGQVLLMSTCPRRLNFIDRTGISFTVPLPICILMLYIYN